MGREEGSGWRTHVYLWRIHFYIWQNQYSIVKFKNKVKLKKNSNMFSISLKCIQVNYGMLTAVYGPHYTYECESWGCEEG